MQQRHGTPLWHKEPNNNRTINTAALRQHRTCGCMPTQALSYAVPVIHSKELENIAPLWKVQGIASFEHELCPNSHVTVAVTGWVKLGRSQKILERFQIRFRGSSETLWISGSRVEQLFLLCSLANMEAKAQVHKEDLLLKLRFVFLSSIIFIVFLLSFFSVSSLFLFSFFSLSFLFLLSISFLFLFSFFFLSSLFLLSLFLLSFFSLSFLFLLSFFSLSPLYFFSLFLLSSFFLSSLFLLSFFFLSFFSLSSLFLFSFFSLSFLFLFSFSFFLSSFFSLSASFFILSELAF